MAVRAWRLSVFSIFAVALLCAGSCTAGTSHDSTPVAQLDLQRYLGKWYEIARFDHKFERGMENVTAEYILKEDGTIQVINSGWKDGEKKVAEGKAKCPDPVGNPAHLRVSFFLFFYSDYNILYVDALRKILRISAICGQTVAHMSPVRPFSCRNHMCNNILEQ